MSPNNVDLFEALLAGATGCLLKDMSAARLPAALCGVLAGEAALPGTLERRLIEEFRARDGASPRPPEVHAGAPAGPGGADRARVGGARAHLRAPLEHVVAQRRGISEVAVRRHVSPAMDELDVTNRACALQRQERDQLAGRVVGMRVDVARRRRPMLCTLALAVS